MTRIWTSGRTNAELLPLLKTVDQWICWDADRYGSDGKIPIDPDEYIDWKNEFKSSSYKNKSIYNSYKDSKLYSKKHNAISGIGFVFTGVKVSYIDIDGCVDPETMEISENAHEIISDLSSYTELSASGTGIHILCRGNAPSYGWSAPDNSIEVSVFDESWLAITQRHIQDTPLEVTGNEWELRKLCNKHNIDTHGGW